MSKHVFLCNNCGVFFVETNEPDSPQTCPRCRANMISMGLTESNWKNYPLDERERLQIRNMSKHSDRMALSYLLNIKNSLNTIKTILVIGFICSILAAVLSLFG